MDSAQAEKKERIQDTSFKGSMTISVILCTYNRCVSLARALNSLAVSSLPEGTEWEVLVVDNNSKDQTREVVERFCQSYPERFRYFFEPRQGKSNALNSGIREAHGEILVFTDDDVTVEPAWLEYLTAPLHNARWAGCGGRILPEPGFSPPPWLAIDGPMNQLGALCAYFEPADLPGELDRPPIGANMAFRRETFLKYGGFRTDLGPRPGSELRHEDTEFGRRLMAGGDRLCYVPSAIVYHEIHPSRVQKSFFLSWWFGIGRGSIRETGKIPSTAKILRIVARIVLRTLKSVLGVNSQRRFYSKCWLWYEVGMIVEIYQHARRSDAGTRDRSKSVTPEKAIPDSPRFR
jgi:glycosyltransferase involved in cell wall biosynthesis